MSLLENLESQKNGDFDLDAGSARIEPEWTIENGHLVVRIPLEDVPGNAKELSLMGTGPSTNGNTCIAFSKHRISIVESVGEQHGSPVSRRTGILAFTCSGIFKPEKPKQTA